MKCVKTVTELASGEKRTVRGLEFDNETGHYRATISSLEAEIIRFKCLGYGLSVVKDWKTNQPIDLDEKCKISPPEYDCVLYRIECVGWRYGRDFQLSF
ncbi:hypothetical protein [Candidatus Ichthyocystis hellenicum]|uniref:hypothetical protein n=1 Tax=Candidatus Ichthyocystis hellenicum TaxID=1561003 RepID=UPI001111A1EF|nr:hypothetical protein [Candidatus Ichthyocystis hellenicum]